MPFTPTHRSFNTGWSMIPSTGSPLMSKEIKVPHSGFPARQIHSPSLTERLAIGSTDPAILSHFESCLKPQFSRIPPDAPVYVWLHWTLGIELKLVKAKRRGRHIVDVAWWLGVSLPVMKLFVPSIGSSTHRYALLDPASIPASSPKMPWSGNLSLINLRIASSVSLSAIVTGLKSPFDSTNRSDLESQAHRCEYVCRHMDLTSQACDPEKIWMVML